MPLKIMMVRKSLLNSDQYFLSVKNGKAVKMSVNKSEPVVTTNRWLILTKKVTHYRRSKSDENTSFWTTSDQRG